MREQIAAIRALTEHMITDSMARAESWNAFNTTYARARRAGIEPDKAYDEAAEAQVRAYLAIVGPANDRFPPDSHLDAALDAVTDAINPDYRVLEQVLNRRV